MLADKRYQCFFQITVFSHLYQGKAYSLKLHVFKANCTGECHVFV